MFNNLSRNSQLCRKPPIVLLTISLIFITCVFDSHSAQAAVRAEVVLAAPPVTSLITLNATIPVSPGFYTDADAQAGIQKLGVIDANGTTVPGQMDIVARNASGSASIILFSALVHTNSTLRYQIVDHISNSTPVTTTSVLRTLTTLPGLDPKIKNFLLTPNAIKIATRDPFDNDYEIKPLTYNASNTRVFSNGPQQRTIRSYGVTEPVNPGAANLLPHMIGTHSYFTVTPSGTSAGIKVTFRLSNGFSGLDTTSKLDDPIGVMWMKYITLTLAPGFSFVEDVTTPTGNPIPVINPDGSKTYYLLKPEAYLHEFPDQTTTTRTGMIVEDANVAMAQAQLANLNGVGFVAEGTDPNLWGWWNNQTPNFGTNGTPLYKHDENVVTRAALNAYYNGIYNQFKNAVETGKCTKDSQGACTGPVYADVAGLFQWEGPDYGGATGGGGVYVQDGTKIANAYSLFGLLTTKLQARLHASRDRMYLTNRNGSPLDLRQILKACPTGGMGQKVQFDAANPGLPKSNTAGVLGFNNPAYAFHRNAAQTLGLLPPYDAALNHVDSYDMQHRIRGDRLYIVLATLLGDPVAIERMDMAGRVIEATYSPFPLYTNNKCNIIGGTLLSHHNSVTSNPEQGIDSGRDKAWEANAMNEAYIIGDPTWRQNTRSWFETFADIIAKAQVPCTGHWYTNWTPGKQISYLNVESIQLFETTFTANALLGMRYNVLADDPIKVAQIETTLINYYRAIINPEFFETTNPTTGAGFPWKLIATKNHGNPLYAPGQIFCPGDPIYANGGKKDSGSYEIGNPLGNAYRLTGDPVFLEKAHDVLGKNYLDLLTEAQKDLEAKANDDQIFHWSVLLDVAQAQHGY